MKPNEELSIKYVTQFWANFDPLPLSHFVTDRGTRACFKKNLSLHILNEKFLNLLVFSENKFLIYPSKFLMTFFFASYFFLVHHCTNSLSLLHICVHHCTFCASLHVKISPARDPLKYVTHLGPPNF